MVEVADKLTKSERIEIAIQHYNTVNGANLSWNGLVKGLNKSPGATRAWKQNKISEQTLSDMAEFLGVSYLWLLTGKSSMLDLGDKMVSKLDGEQTAYEAVGLLFVQWLELTENTDQLQTKIQILMDQIRVKPDVATQAEIIKLQTQALQEQTKAHNLYINLIVKAQAAF